MQRCFLFTLLSSASFQCLQVQLCLPGVQFWFLSLEALSFYLDSSKAVDSLLAPVCLLLSAAQICFLTYCMVYSLVLTMSSGKSSYFSSVPSRIFWPNCMNSMLLTCLYVLSRNLAMSQKKVILKKLFLKLVPRLKYSSVYLMAQIGLFQEQVNILSDYVNFPSYTLSFLEAESKYFLPNYMFLGKASKYPTCATLFSLLNFTPSDGVSLKPMKVSPEAQLQSTTSACSLSRVNCRQLLKLRMCSGISVAKI